MRIILVLAAALYFIIGVAHATEKAPPIAEPKLSGKLVLGKLAFGTHCAACHGANGRSEVVVMHMDETPQDQSDTEYMKNLPDVYLYLAICKGGEGVGKSYVMSPWGDYFSHQEITDMIAWIRTFSNT